MSKRKHPSNTAAAETGDGTAGNPVSEMFENRGTRETIESIAVAFVLAFVFRMFVVEAFVIPTGSMAPTLMGRHKDHICPKCGSTLRVGASAKMEMSPGGGPVSKATCGNCRFNVDLSQNTLDNRSFTGDRILVSKYPYDFWDPLRWDVIVFKNPNRAHENYIKRLVGRPGETLRLEGGDVYVKKGDDDKFHIARKPPRKLRAMLQKVHDTQHISKMLVKAGWPLSWRPAVTGEEASPGVWTFKDTPSNENVLTRSFSIADAPRDSVAWLRYHHVQPNSQFELISNGDGKVELREVKDWNAITRNRNGNTEVLNTFADRPDQLITDFYTYNAASFRVPRKEFQDGQEIMVYADYSDPAHKYGRYWVGDLALECKAEVASDTGFLWLDLVEGGRHHKCRIDTATGEATLSIVSIEGEAFPFVSEEDGKKNMSPKAVTPVKGAGTYNLRFSNVDDQLTLWVNNSPIKFDFPTTYPIRTGILPQWSATDQGDLAPAGIGAEGSSLKVSNLCILRDIYYIAAKSSRSSNSYEDGEYTERVPSLFMAAYMNDPRRYEEKLFEILRSRRSVEFVLEEDQFFPMGDNSPSSLDARLWGKDHYLDRRFLIGKALYVYWPHALNYPIPYVTPNIQRMRPIR